MRASIFVGLYGLCVAAVLTFYAVYEWLEPLTVMMIAAAAVILPTIAIVYGLEEDARPPKPNLVIWVQSLLVMMLFGLAIPGVWFVADARARALDALGTTKAIEGAFSDPAPVVTETACSLLFSERLDVRSGEITDMLTRHPERAAQCLEIGADSVSAPMVTRQLTLSWHESLVSGTDCSIAPALSRLPISETNKAALLLDCSLRGTAETRTCCAAQLDSTLGRDLRKTVAEARDLVIELNTTSHLLTASFGEETARATFAPVTKQLGLDTKEFQKLALELSCSAITEESGRPEDMQVLEWLFGEHESCIEAEGVTNVISACEVLLERGLDQRPDLGRALCEANQLARTNTLERAAAFKTGVKFGDSAAAIDSGRSALREDQLDPKNFREMMMGGEISNLSDEQRKALFKNMQRQGSIDPSNPMALTEGQARAQHAQMQTKEGREKFKKSKAQEQALQTADAEKAMGISMDEIRASMNKDGEVSDEMKERLDKLKSENKQ